MSVAIAYFLFFLLVVITELTTNKPLEQSMIDDLNKLFSTTNILIASGVLGVCFRLDKIVKAQKEMNTHR